MNELSLFSGAGGGLLGSKLLGWRTIGYVEFNDYCQRVLKARIKDGILDEAPIFGDIRAFTSEGWARSYQGMVDVLTAGFPCQPFSTAGKQLAEKDDRNMWPETAEVIRVVRPSIIFLENVPGLLACEYAITIFNDLAKIGYEALPPLRLGAFDVGADHKRERVWIIAYPKHQGLQPNRKSDYLCVEGGPQSALVRQNLLERATERDAIEGRSDFPKPLLFRNVDEMANWVERLKATGNGQVPSVAAKAWEILNVPT